MTSGNWNSGYSYFAAGSHLATYAGEKIWAGSNGFEWVDGEIHRGKPWNGYTMLYRSWRKLSGDRKITLYSYDTGPDGSDVDYAWPLVPTPNLNDWDAMKEIDLLQKLSKKIKGHDFHVGVSLAEVDKTASMVTKRLGQIMHGVWELSRGNVPGALRVWGSTARKVSTKTKLKVTDISGTFLELRYGWTPLVQDVYAGAKAFEEISNGPRGITFRSGKKFSVNIPSNNPQGIVRNYFGGTVHRSYVVEQYEEMDALRSMGLLDPASVLWERLPWSFVVDWFIPIGSYLELIGTIPYLKGRFCRTTSAENFTEESVPDIIYPGVTIGPIPQFTCRDFRLNRTILESLSVPFPKVHVAGAVQGKRVGNAIALAHQMFARALSPKSSTRLRHGAAFEPSYFHWPDGPLNFDR